MLVRLQLKKASPDLFHWPESEWLTEILIRLFASTATLKNCCGSLFPLSLVRPWQAFKGNGTQQRSLCVTQDLILTLVAIQKYCVTSGFQVIRPLTWVLYNCDISLVSLTVFALAIKFLFWLLSLLTVLAVYDCSQVQYVFQIPRFCSENRTVLVHIVPKLNAKFLRRLINLPRNICWSPCCICRVLSCWREKFFIVVSWSTFEFCFHDIIKGWIATWLQIAYFQSSECQCWFHCSKLPGQSHWHNPWSSAWNIFARWLMWWRWFWAQQNFWKGDLALSYIPNLCRPRSLQQSHLPIPERVTAVGRSFAKLESSFSGNVSMDALENKFSVNSAPPDAVMSRGDGSVWFWKFIDVTRFGYFRHVRSYVLVQFVVTSFTSSGS